MIKDLRNRIITDLKTVSAFSNEVYGYAKPNLTRFPSALVLFRGAEFDDSTVSFVEVSYSFDIHVYMELKQSGLSTGTDKFLDVIDVVEDVLLTDRDLGGVISGQVQFSVSIKETKIQELNEGKLLVGIIGISVLCTKTTNL